MKYKGEIMEQLPISIEKLTLDLYRNDLGGILGEMKWIGEGMKQLFNLENLTLFIYKKELS